MGKGCPGSTVMPWDAIAYRWDAGSSCRATGACRTAAGVLPSPEVGESQVFEGRGAKRVSDRQLVLFDEGQVHLFGVVRHHACR